MDVAVDRCVRVGPVARYVDGVSRMSGALVAIDPGSITGIAWVYQKCSVERLFIPLQSEGETGDTVHRDAKKRPEVEVAAGIIDTLDAIEAVHGLQRVIVESFTLRAFTMDASLLAPVRMIAYMEAIAFERSMDVPWYFQPPSAMTVINRKRMEAWNLWVRGQQKDERQAVRHLAAYVRKFTA